MQPCFTIPSLPTTRKEEEEVEEEEEKIVQVGRGCFRFILGLRGVPPFVKRPPRSATVLFVDLGRVSNLDTLHPFPYPEGDGKLN
jgi:hypothetical protein